MAVSGLCKVFIRVLVSKTKMHNIRPVYILFCSSHPLKTKCYHNTIIFVIIIFVLKKRRCSLCGTVRSSECKVAPSSGEVLKILFYLRMGEMVISTQESQERSCVCFLFSHSGRITFLVKHSFNHSYFFN